MKNRKLILSTLIALSAVAFTSCIDDPEPAALDGLTDVYVKKSLIDGEEKYGLYFWSYGNKALDTVTVEGPNDEIYNLSSEQSSKIVFTLSPDSADYTDVMPATGNYVFSIKSSQDGEESITVADKLEDAELDLIAIDSTAFVSSKLKTYWTKVDDVDAYMVRLYDDSNELIYVSPQMASSKTDFSFGTSDTGWADSNSKAEEGETYRLEVMALLFESTSSQGNYEYNLQFISTASTEIVWGE